MGNYVTPSASVVTQRRAREREAALQYLRYAAGEMIQYATGVLIEFTRGAPEAEMRAAIAAGYAAGDPWRRAAAAIDALEAVLRKKL